MIRFPLADIGERQSPRRRIVPLRFALRGRRANASAMTLGSEEVERYARQIVLRGVGGPGQNRLKAARVLVVGAGGLGSPALQYLAGAGVGTLGIVDDDVVALSNLHRQILHGTPDVGRPKTESAADAIARLNPHVAVEPIPVRLDEGNARALARRFDVVLDGSDNFATRYALSDACFFERRPLVAGALGEFDATLTTLKPYEAGADGKPNPTYRCLFPEAPPPGTIPTCAEAGVLGAMAGVLGALMALEAIREIVGGFADGNAGLVGRLLMIDARAMRFETFRYHWDEANPLSGTMARARG
jgi:molybdopterin-synthase adenylyltransferase